MKLWNIFGVLYASLWAALITIEIIGATTGYRVTDTMSEYFWKFQEGYPNLANMLMTGGLAVLWYHLVLSKGVIK